MDIKSKLNEKQFLAATCRKQYLRIVAGAGTGKTRTLTYRLAYLISEGILPRKIVAITFTNKVAREMQERVESILKENNFEIKGSPLISTFHGFCYRFLKKEIDRLPGYNKNFAIADETDQNAIYKEIFSKMSKGSVKEFTSSLIKRISDLKTDGVFNTEISPKDVPFGSNFNFDELKHVYDTYQKKLRVSNLLDFDDLLMLTVKIMREFEEVRKHWQMKYDMFLIDEFQDTNEVQYELVKLFLDGHNMLTVVGDPDQTIYSWRGAKNKIIKDTLEKDFPTLETIVLDYNYRSTANILDMSNKLISNNKDRVKKDLIAANNIQGNKVELLISDDQENEGYRIACEINRLVKFNGYKFNDIAIIYRSNYLSNPLEKQLTTFKIPYVVYGGFKFFERAEIKAAISYLRLLVNPDDYSFKTVLHAPTKGVGDKSYEDVSLYRDENYKDEYLFNVFYKDLDSLKLTAPCKEHLRNFFRAYDEAKNIYLNHQDNDELLTGIRDYLSHTGFMEWVNNEDKKMQKKYEYTPNSTDSKVDNVNELLRTLTNYLGHKVIDEDGNERESTLEDFLIDVALQSDQDNIDDANHVFLMTGHVAKGLEFKVVFVAGLVQGVFPTTHAINSFSPNAIEEERRLFYVSMTRAKELLFLSTNSGFNVRSKNDNTPSMFLKELEILPTKKKISPTSSYQAHVGANKPTRTVENREAINKFMNQYSSYGSKQDNTSKDTYIIGDEVIHTSFGRGKVVELVGNDKIVVEFKDGSRRKLMIGFKAFRKVKEGE